ncbi:MAG: hypothetical protein QW514_04715 [Thermoprotei archaeon]
MLWWDRQVLRPVDGASSAWRRSDRSGELPVNPRCVGYVSP